MAWESPSLTGSGGVLREVATKVNERQSAHDIEAQTGGRAYRSSRSICRSPAM